MEKFFLFFLCLWLTACRQQQAKVSDRQFTDIVRLKTTPVKQQGRSETCWIYAMLATIETERLMKGDSINLSPHYVSRMFLRERLTHYYLSRGQSALSLRGMAPMLLRLLDQYGAEPYDTYGATTSVSYSALCRKAEQMARTCQSFSQLDERFDSLMDAEVGFLPRYIFMAGAEYTPLQFARSIYKKGDYEALTSYTHHPFGQPFALETPDNRDLSTFVNVPIDEMMRRIDAAILAGHPVCWEGDISNQHFSFEQGVADLRLPQGDIQQLRQQAFERLKATDDHCLCLVGIAEDEQHRRYYLAKNSWGTDNPYDGFIYLSADYLRIYTLCAIVPNNP